MLSFFFFFLLMESDEDNMHKVKKEYLSQLSKTLW